MKNFFAILFGALLSMGTGAGLFAWQAVNVTPPQKPGTPANTTTNFKLDSKRMVADLQNRYAVVPPMGQLWGFNADQKVDLQVLQVKPHPVDDDVVVVAVKISSSAQVNAALPTNGQKAESAPTDKQVTLDLTGVAKLHYELIADEWYLIDISSVSLKVAQK